MTSKTRSSEEGCHALRETYATHVRIVQAVRSCPVCRQTTHFVTPSKVWPRTAEEKALIIGQYKERLGSIDCKYWSRGEVGDQSCPFGSSCFYRHRGAEVRLPFPVPWPCFILWIATQQAVICVLLVLSQSRNTNRHLRCGSRIS